jgi:hypothetical protein
MYNRSCVSCFPFYQLAGNLISSGFQPTVKTRFGLIFVQWFLLVAFLQYLIRLFVCLFSV